MKIITHIMILCAVIVTGCLTQRQLIESRIREKQNFFDALPPEAQARLRKGELSTGDSAEAAWIVYGSPDHKFIKVTGTATNELWSYCSYEYDRTGHPRPVAHQVSGGSRGSIRYFSHPWAGSPSYSAYEYLKIEFQNNRIQSYEEEKR